MSKPSRVQVAQWGQQADKIAQPLTHSWAVELCAIARYDLEATIEALRQQLAESKTKNEQLEEVVSQRTFFLNDAHQKLAECQATNGMRREALKPYANLCPPGVPQLSVSDYLVKSIRLNGVLNAQKALALPNDDTALNELIAERTASLTAEVDRIRTHHELFCARAFKNQSKMTELTAEIEQLKADKRVALLLLDKAELQNAELTAQRDAAMTDAERYRWLRLQEWSEWEECFWKYTPDNTPNKLDKAIDAAIANCKEQNKK